MVGELKAGNAVRAALDAADLFVMPSRTEGLPKAMIEAMARGLPCIGSRVGGIPELLEEEEMFRPDDPGNLAAKIAEVLGDPARMARLSRRNLEVARRYTADVLRTRRNEFYLRVRAGTEAWLEEHHSLPQQPQLGHES